MRRSWGLGIVRLATVAYTMTFLGGTVLSIRRGYIAEPLGIRTGLSPLADVLAGFGSALAAPWGLIALLWQADAAAGRPGRQGTRARARLAALGALFLVGSVAEPVTHRAMARQLPVSDRIVVVLNTVLPVLISGGALASLVSQEERP